jgi:hypothetical protein
MTRRRGDVRGGNLIENKKKVCVRLTQTDINIKGGGRRVTRGIETMTNDD